MHKLISLLTVYLLWEKIMNFKAEQPPANKVKDKKEGEIFEYGGEMWMKLRDGRVAQMWASEERRGMVH